MATAAAVLSTAVCVLGVLRGTLSSEQACLAVHRQATRLGALLFLAFFAGSLASRATSSWWPWINSVTTALRAGADDLLAHCSFLACLQLAAVVGLAAFFPTSASGSPAAPVYAAGYASLLVLAVTQRRPRLKGRVKLEIEPGEGDRQPVMNQGARLAARNYCWFVLAAHLAWEAWRGVLSGAAVLPEVGLALLYLLVGAAKFGALQA